MLALTGCTAFNNSDDGTADGNGTSATTQTFQPSGGKPTATLSIASGSENKEVAVAIQKAADQSNVAVTMHYMGSLEIMNALKAGGQDHDAVWPASSMWISMGDTKHIVKDAASTSTTPIIKIRLVVLIMRVIRLMLSGIRRRTVCGMMMYQ